MKLAHKKLVNNQVPLELFGNALCSNTNNIPLANILGYNQNLNIMYNGIKFFNVDLLLKNNLANFGNIYFPNVYFNNY